MRDPILSEIRTYSDDPSSMKGDPLEDLGKLFMFIFLLLGIGVVALVIKRIIWIVQLKPIYE
jgi:hypothetical protein